MSDLKHVVVVGASAGGFEAISKLIAGLPDNMPAAMFIVIHLSQASQASIIKQYFEKNTNYTCLIPQNEEQIKAGHIYIAPPDFHMLLKGSVIRLTKGPHENRWRPSINALFRSAAAVYDSRAIGIILSGMMDDGTSGMSAIKRSGGICIVQEPAEAQHPDMVNSVLYNVDVDYQVPVSDMGYILDDIFSKPVHHDRPIPEDVKLEADITERMSVDLPQLSKLGVHSDFVCPDCGGGLWEMKNEKALRFRCHTGHVYTANALLEKQGEELEESVWVSIRMLEERRNLLLQMANRESAVKMGNYKQAQTDRAEGLSLHINRLKDLLISISKKFTPDEGHR
jgi:two-component system chemotaxis response regulator CheB